MAYLDKWKNAKKAFEKATGQDKPAEKGSVLGVAYRKSSGLEDALKTLDKALEKKSPPEAVTALAGYKRAFESYYPTLEKSAKASTDSKHQTEVLKLVSALNHIHSEAAEDVKKLEKDPKSIMTVAEAIGPDAVKAFNDCKLFSNGDLTKWLSDASTGAIMVKGKLVKDPESAKCQADGKKAYAALKKLYENFKGALAKKSERGKALAFAEKFHGDFESSYHAMAGDATLMACVGRWSGESQLEAYQAAEEAGTVTDLRGEYQAWVGSSAGWKAAQNLAGAWSNCDGFLSDFHSAISAQK